MLKVLGFGIKDDNFATVAHFLSAVKQVDVAKFVARRSLAVVVKGTEHDHVGRPLGQGAVVFPGAQQFRVHHVLVVAQAVGQILLVGDLHFHRKVTLAVVTDVDIVADGVGSQGADNGVLAFH